MRTTSTNLFGIFPALVVIGVVGVAVAQTISQATPRLALSVAVESAEATSPRIPAESDRIDEAEVLTPDGMIVPVVRAQRVVDDADAVAAQGPPNETVLYWSDSADFYGAKDWYQVYDLANDMALPYAISRVSAYSGDLGDTNAYCGKDRYHLIVVYQLKVCHRLSVHNRPMLIDSVYFIRSLLGKSLPDFRCRLYSGFAW